MTTGQPAPDPSLAELVAALKVLEREPLSEVGRIALAVLQRCVPATATVPLARLTTRQRQVAELMAEGVSNRGIAVALGLREGTAKLHVAAVLNRLGASSREQVAGIITATPDE